MFPASMEDVETLFSDSLLEGLAVCGFKPLPPRELIARRSVIVTRVDSSIFDYSPEDLRVEIESRNPGLKVAHVKPFAIHRGVKVIFSSSQFAKRVLSQGLSLFYLHLPGTLMRQETPSKIRTCYKCYSVDGHFASKCTKGVTNKACANCASVTHTWRDCTSEKKTCVSCGGAHHTMSRFCPIRINAQEEAETSHRNGKTYAAAVSSSKTQVAHVPKVIVAKSVTCVVLAALKNIEHPGTFEKELNNLLQINSMPKLNLVGFDPPAVVMPYRDSSKEESTTQDRAPEAGLDIKARSPVRQCESVATVPLPEPPGQGNASINSQLDTKGNSPKKRPWTDKKVYKVKSSMINNNSDLSKAWDDGLIVITNIDGSVPDYSEVAKMLEGCEQLPKFIELKKSDFKSLSSSPSRFLRSRGGKDCQ